jgi:beta-lactamase superfamily II metal-dependent hydrolase
MNPFLDQKSEYRKPPSRIYARIDSVEMLNPERLDVVIYAAGVDATWYDELFGRFAKTESLPPSAIERMDRAPLVITELWLADLDASDVKELRPLLQPGQWVRIDDGGGGIPVAQYTSLFGPLTQTNVSIERVRKEFARQLDAAFSLSSVPDAPETQIRTIMGKAPDVDFISVLDVGQGSACGLWREQHGARLYFDLGGGAVANSGTFPTGRLRLCRSQDPPVILSHWDWDHWSSAMRFPEFLDLPWLAPRQDLDPIHLAFAHQLHKRGNLHVWPDTTTSIREGPLRIEKCGTPDGRDKNNNGLAMTVEGAGFGHPYRALLPGDAGFDSIPSVTSGESFDAIVASHHGAQVGAISTMTAPMANAALVYSYGHANTYGHPRLHAALEYLQAGWLPPRTYSTTQSRRQRPCTVGLRLNRRGQTTGCDDCQPKIWT